MKLVKGPVEYVFPEYSVLTDLSLKTRTGATSKAFTHGGLPTGDGRIDSRKISIEVLLIGTSEVDYFSKVNALKAALYGTDQKLYITDLKYINIKSLESIDEQYFPGSYMRESKITARLLAVDPFIYDDTSISVITEVIATPTTFTVNNPGNVDTPAIITITATAACTSISITNITDSNRLATYNDPQMVTGQVLTIDAETGTVELGTSNTLNNFGGTFLSLLPGDNDIQYEGGNCVIEISAGKRCL